MSIERAVALRCRRCESTDLIILTSLLFRPRYRNYVRDVVDGDTHIFCVCCGWNGTLCELGREATNEARDQVCRLYRPRAKKAVVEEVRAQLGKLSRVQLLAAVSVVPLYKETLSRLTSQQIIGEVLSQLTKRRAELILKYIEHLEE